MSKNFRDHFSVKKIDLLTSESSTFKNVTVVATKLKQTNTRQETKIKMKMQLQL